MRRRFGITAAVVNDCKRDLALSSLMKRTGSHLYIHEYKWRSGDRFQIVSLKYVGWWSNHATRSEAEIALQEQIAHEAENS